MTNYLHLNAADTLARAGELRDVYAAVFSQPPYNEGPEMPDRFVGWLRDESAEDGFAMVVAEDQGRIVGFAYGNTMPAGTWWDNAEVGPPDGLDTPAKFVVQEWAVLPEARGAGVGHQLMGSLLARRPERWATLLVNPAADARRMYERAGWSKVGRSSGRTPMDIMVLKLGQRRMAA